MPLGLPGIDDPRSLVTGDFDGDGFEDMAVVRAGFSSCDDGVGCPVVPGSATGPDLASAFGLALTPLWAGDLDGDGIDDLVTGDSEALGRFGVAAVHYGAPSGLSVSADQTFDGIDGEGLGSAATAADLDGDGAIELVLGASRWNDGSGRLLVFEP